MIALDIRPILIIKKRPQLSYNEINDWNKLREEENGSLFSSYDWVKAGVNSIEQGNKIIVALGYQNNKLIFVLPLVIKKVLFMSLARSPNKKFLDQSCILSQSDLLLPFFITKLKVSISNFILYEVSEFLKEKLLQSHCSIFIEHASTSFSLDIKNVGPYYNFSKKSFKDLIRLQKQGNFQLNILSSHEIFSTNIFNFESISSKFGTSRRIFHQKKHQTFFTEIIKIPYIKAYFLKKEDENIAFDLGGTLRGEAFSLYRAYQKKYHKYSPGNILQHKQIQEFIKEKITFYHLYRGYTYQKKCFANTQYEQYNLYFVSNILLKSYFRIILYLKAQYIPFKIFVKKIIQTAFT